LETAWLEYRTAEVRGLAEGKTLAQPVFFSIADTSSITDFIITTKMLDKLPGTRKLCGFLQKMAPFFTIKLEKASRGCKHSDL
jgi:hypothetical protein